MKHAHTDDVTGVMIRYDRTGVTAVWTKSKEPTSQNLYWFTVVKFTFSAEQPLTIPVGCGAAAWDVYGMHVAPLLQVTAFWRGLALTTSGIKTL